MSLNNIQERLEELYRRATTLHQSLMTDTQAYRAQLASVLENSKKGANQRLRRVEKERAKTANMS